MSIQTQVASRQIFNGDGASKVFSTVFFFFESSTISVTVRTGSAGNYVFSIKQENVDYTVSGGRTGPGDPETGSVEFVTAPAADAKVILERLEPFSQLNSYDRNGPVPGPVIEQQDDRNVFQNQQLSDFLTRVPVVPADRAVSAGAPELPESDDGKILIGLANGAGWVNGELVLAGTIVIPVPVGQGGTGGTNQLGAQQNLGLEPGVDVNEFLSTVTKAAAEAGTDTSRTVFTASRVREAIVNIAPTRGELAYAYLIMAAQNGDALDMIEGIADNFNDTSDVDTGASTGEVHIAGGASGTGFYFENTEEVLNFNDAPVGSNSVLWDGVNPFAGIGFTTPASPIWRPRRMRVDLNTLGGTPDEFLPSMYERGNPVKLGDGDLVDVSGGVTGTYESSFSTPFPLAISTAHNMGVQLFGVWTSNMRTVARPSTGTGFTFLSSLPIYSLGGYNGIDAGEDLRFGLVLSTEMVLQSVAFTAATQPTRARFFVIVSELEAVTLNTDVIAEVSRDGGVTWTAAVLNNRLPIGASIISYEDQDIDISSQPAGTSMKYRIRYPTGKRVQVEGVVFQWGT